MCGSSRSIIGTDGITTPRCPRPTARLISFAAASTGASGTMHCGMKRGLSAAHSSISQSL
jgi:hypothetical protein